MNERMVEVKKDCGVQVAGLSKDMVK